MSVAWPTRTTDWDDAVASFLRANPDWLASHPEVYRSLRPPTRVHGEVLADHMAAMVFRERQHAAKMAELTEAVLAAGRAATAMMARVPQAVVALVTSEDLAECLAVELPHILEVDAVCLCRRDGLAPLDGHVARLERLLAHRDVLFRVSPDDALALYSEAAGLARHDVLIRLPSVGVLGLACRYSLESRLHPPRLGLQFLGQVAATILGRSASPESSVNQPMCRKMVGQ
jgi:uncharacterized protein YigA (DUF484 family)